MNRDQAFEVCGLSSKSAAGNDTLRRLVTFLTRVLLASHLKRHRSCTLNTNKAMANTKTNTHGVGDILEIYYSPHSAARDS